MVDSIVNLAKVPNVGLIVKLALSQGINHLERALSTKRAVYSGTGGLVTQVVELDEDKPSIDIHDKVQSLVLAISGAPVVFTAELNVAGTPQLVNITVTKLFVLDQALESGFSLQTTGTSQVDLNYQT